MLKVLIIANRPNIRNILKKNLLNYKKDFQVDEAEDGFRAIEKIIKKKYDVVLLDIPFTGKGGLDILYDIKKEKPKLKVIILTTYNESEYTIRSISSGATGYLTKHYDPSDLRSAIYSVVYERKIINNINVKELIYNLEQDYEKYSIEKLSNREIHIMRLIEQGKSIIKNIRGNVTLFKDF